ncbi:Restriction endonuclease, type I, EcoRI, R subunit/Type III [Thalassoporum mexicanum PCC 7367]|uniref:type I restriction endonuclease n=1 Tax=Thalassoporum mexicanum TaxID=3457544 RepID=UPI00029FDE04|nr:type I restriction endonuclease [Pseudanabaena sp. PCC 7367]AFY69992.1 Restriction endonuclease, type I, EcoRI, R subunit/Type III [Pseudanabaena sp. PCC 7367]
MDFIDEIRTLAQRIEKQQEHIQTEEATKNAFIMPFIQALGYNVFNIMEVCPEYTADYPGLKGKKVDYAILMEGKPVILFECKWCGETLENPRHSSQLHAYFHVTEAKFGVLTNGIIYRFYTDIEKDNVMDEKPFFEFNLLEFTDASVNELKRFSKTGFNPDELGDAARDLLYTKGIKRIMAEQFTNPDNEFVKFFAKQVYSGRLTENVVEKFAVLTKKSLKEFINDRIADRLQSVIDLPDPDANEKDTESDEESELESEPSNGIVTTEAEMQSYYIVKSILGGMVDTERIQHKDTRSYFGINLDGKATKTICRVRIYEDSANQESVGSIDILDEDKKEGYCALNGLDDLYSLAPQLKARLASLLGGKASKTSSGEDEQE